MTGKSRPTTNAKNDILLHQAKNARHVERHDEVEIFYRTRLIDFNLIYKSDPPNKLQALIEAILNECIQHNAGKYGYGKESKKELRSYVQALILNLMQNERLMKSCPIHLSISLDRNDYTTDSGREFETQSYERFIMIYRAMSSKELGYILERQKGHAGFNGNKGGRTSIEATAKLRDAITNAAGDVQIDIIKRDKGKRCIVLRDRDKNGMQYTEDRDTRRMSRNVRKFNKLIATADITIQIPEQREEHFRTKLKEREDVENYSKPYLDFTATQLRRVFSNGSLEQGGRFYNVWWHSVPARPYNYRKHILIDGQETVELDYSKMHPTMLYHEEGYTLEEGFDPYVPFDGANRKFGKRAWNGLLNTTRHNPKQVDKYDATKNEGMEWPEFLDAIMEHNKLIQHRLKTGYGIFMQYTDSIIAERVMLTLYNKGIVCLPVHDSFIVQRKHRGVLEDAMLSASCDILGITLKVDDK